MAQFDHFMAVLAQMLRVSKSLPFTIYSDPTFLDLEALTVIVLVVKKLVLQNT